MTSVDLDQLTEIYFMAGFYPIDDQSVDLDQLIEIYSMDGFYPIDDQCRSRSAD